MLAKIDISTCALQKFHSGLKQANAVRERMAAAAQSQLQPVDLPSSAEAPAATLDSCATQGILEHQSSLPGRPQLAQQAMLSKAISMPSNHASLLRAYAADVSQSQCSTKANRMPHSPQRHILGALFIFSLEILHA